MELQNMKIAIIGLGYVGLPLAVEFGKIREVIGFDTNLQRVDELNMLKDKTLETTSDELKSAVLLTITSDPSMLIDANIFIISVPTPVDKNNQPNTKALEGASKTIAKYLKKNDIVIYESTVYPGCTKELCVPILEANSGLIFNEEFYCGYSPERINPGDKEHRLVDIVKVTSGSTKATSLIVDALYKEIIKAGTFIASSIEVAEAAKVIENTQRDVNIALMNELSKIFNLLDIDTKEVLEAAGTKWNFLPFSPGLVGGHCIGVDPYYLTYKSLKLGYKPEVILSGRALNDSIGEYIANNAINLIEKNKITVDKKNILILGLTFKENCPDIRNTKVVDIINTLESNNVKVDIYDPLVDAKEAKEEYGISCLDSIPKDIKYHAIIIAVAHDAFKKISYEQYRFYCHPKGIIYDIKSILPKEHSDLRL